MLQLPWPADHASKVKSILADRAATLVIGVRWMTEKDAQINMSVGRLSMRHVIFN